MLVATSKRDRESIIVSLVNLREGKMKTMCLIVSVVMVVMAALSAQGQGGLKTKFYSSSCPRAEAIVRSNVESHFNKDPTIAAGLLRLHFHDCFVQVNLKFKSLLN